MSKSNEKIVLRKTSSNEQSDDCLIQHGLVTKSNERKSKIQIENNDQSNELIEEINMIISLIISHTFSKKYQIKNRVCIFLLLIKNFNDEKFSQNETHVKNLHDDLNRYDAIYSCFLEKSQKKSNYLNVHLRNRFMNLKSYDKLQTFRENERKRIDEKKRTTSIRCPIYDLTKLKWLRDHLC